MQRDSAKEGLAEARENLNAATSAFKAKQDEVEPLQKGRKDQSDLQRNIQAEFRDLEVRSEQELDAKVVTNSHSCTAGTTSPSSKHILLACQTRVQLDAQSGLPITIADFDSHQAPPDEQSRSSILA